MSFEYHGITIWVIIFWFVIAILLVCALILIERAYRENTRDYKKNANPLSLNTSDENDS